MQDLYCIGGDVLDRLVLDRIQKYSDLVHTAFGIDSVVEKRRQVMVFPPFPSDEETALLLTFSCTAMAIIHHHPFYSTTFSIKELCLTEFMDDSIIHFPVCVHESRKSGHFADFVHMMKTRLQHFGIQWKEPIPREVIPHVPVLVIKNITKRNALAKIIGRSRTEKPLIFRLENPRLYTRSASGWSLLWGNKKTVEK